MIVRAFRGATTSVDTSMRQVKKLLESRGVQETRYTESGDGSAGRLVFEFVHGATPDARRGVRIAVGWERKQGPRGGEQGSTPAMAGRALFWFIKSKLDSIEYGLEEFDVAFMPHLVTSLGPTFAEQPELIADVVAEPQRLALAAESARIALPAGAP